MNCTICGPYFIGKCPHKLSNAEMVEAVASWRSDDFGHDCTALLEAESRALQDIADKYAAAVKRIEQLERTIDMIYRLTDTSTRPIDSMYDLETEMCNINAHCFEVMESLK